MVAVELHHAHAALDVALLPCREFRQRLLPVSGAVRLDVRLAYDHYAVAVAEVVPLGCVRVVACAHRVDVELLHDRYVAPHRLRRHGVRVLRRHLVAVHALEQSALPVQVQDRVLDLDLAEAEAHRVVVDAAEEPPAPVVLDRRHVHDGELWIPEPDAWHVTDLERVALLVAHGELALAEVVGEPRVDNKVLWRLLVLRDEHHASEDARKAPEVLALEVRAVGVLVHLDLDRVAAEPPEVWRDVELGRQAAVFGIPDLLPVHTNEEGAGDALEAQNRAPEPPAPRTLERRRVEADRVAVFIGRVLLVRLLHRVAGAVERARVPCVDVERRIVFALQLPTARHLDLRGLLPVARRFALPFEVPLAVEVDDPF